MQIYITLVRSWTKFRIDESEYIDIIFINKTFLKTKGAHYVAHNRFLYYVIRKNAG